MQRLDLVAYPYPPLQNESDDSYSNEEDEFCPSSDDNERPGEESDSGEEYTSISEGESAESGMVAMTMCCVGEQYFATELAQSRANITPKASVIHLVTQKAMLSAYLFNRG